MNKRIKPLFLLFAVIFLTFSCSKPLNYKFQDKKQITICKGLDTKLANEAYYSFREDLANYTKNKNPQIDYLDYQYSLALYIFKGAEGYADYKGIASPHSIEIFKKLQEEKQLWKNPATGTLDYNSEFMDCLINKIKLDNIKQALLSLRETNSISNVSLAELYRTTIKYAETDEAYAMFIAFETYYKFFSKINK